ncbi:MAG: hypothetical protein K0S67_32 [Nitrososphaeraceae archaeon]|jgi:hypothetical protein|nr:hypothetical protein [Nitrososphaeraceae archaeon]
MNTEPKCPGCGGKYRIINEKCLDCMKRYHYYKYRTHRGLEEQFSFLGDD